MQSTPSFARMPTSTAWLAACVGVVLLWPALAAASDVVPRGSTATGVATASGGRQIITPAAPKNDVSYNAFSRFDVNAAGATFANQDVRARTIVAEVFSPLSSRIEGPVNVDGPRANLILANQNGISVNGASFANFGSLALTTGAVSLRDVQLTPDVTQRYVDLSTRGGEIQIGAGGLDANVIRLELNAKKIGIAGPITNAFTSTTAVTRLVIGDSDATFDTLASPTDNLTPWLTYRAGAAGTPSGNGIAIDITAGSSVRSGRVELIVTDAGAGVRNAGTLAATSGGFRLTSTGQVQQIGGRIDATGDIRIKSQSFAQSNDGDRSSAVVAKASTRIDTELGIRNDGGNLEGQTRSASDTDNPYAVLLNAGTTVDVSTPVGAKDGAVVFGGAGDVAIRAKGDVRVINARVLSNGHVSIETDQALTIETLHADGAARTDWSSGNWLHSKDGFVVDRGTLADNAVDRFGYVHSELGDVSLRAGSVQNIGGTVQSKFGKVSIDAQTDVTNRALTIGTFSLSEHCTLFICRQKANSTEQLVRGDINAGNTLSIKAGGTVLNEGGQFRSIGQQEINAPQIIARAIPIQRTLMRADGLKALFGDTWARLYAADQSGSFTAEQGKLILNGATRQEGGFFTARDGVEGAIDVIRLPYRDPITIDDHLGILRW